MNRGNSSNWVHWLYAVRTGTSTSTDSVTVLTLFPFVDQDLPRLGRLPDRGGVVVCGARRQSVQTPQHVVRRLQSAGAGQQRLPVGREDPPQVAAEPAEVVVLLGHEAGAGLVLARRLGHLPLLG